MAKKRREADAPAWNFPLHIRAWRKRFGLTQEELAERVGLTQGTIAKLERGDVGWSPDTLEALAEAFECTPGDLFREPSHADSELVAYVKRLDGRAARKALRLLHTALDSDGIVEDAA